MSNSKDIDRSFFEEHPEINKYYRPPQLKDEGQGDIVYVSFNRETDFIFRDEFDRKYLGREKEAKVNEAFDRQGWCDYFQPDS